MAPLAIYARRFPAERFAMLTSLTLGAGSLGTLVATGSACSDLGLDRLARSVFRHGGSDRG